MKLVSMAVSAVAMGALATSCAPRPQLPPRQDPRPLSAMGIGISGRPALEMLPSDQAFAFVPATALFAGTHERDTAITHRRHQRKLKDNVGTVLASIGWREVDAADAKYRVSILYAERQVSRGPRGTNLHPVSAGDGTSCFIPSLATLLYRGLAIERVSDGAVFWRLYAGSGLDNEMLEKRFSQDVVGLAYFEVPAFPAPNARPTFTGSVLRCVAAPRNRVVNGSSPTVPAQTPPSPQDIRDPGVGIKVKNEPPPTKTPGVPQGPQPPPNQPRRPN